MRYAPIEASGGFVALAVGLAALALATWSTVQLHRNTWDHAAATTGGDPHRGEAMFIDYGCGSCHHLQYVRKASGAVGPSLDGIATQAMIAGKLNNTPDNLETWIRNPQAVTPGTAMPDLHVSRRDARDITAFLYTRSG